MFPATKDTCAIARFSFMLVDYEFVTLFSPSFYHLAGMDISYVDGGPLAQIVIEDYQSVKLTDCDVLYLDYEESLSDLQVYTNVIKNAEIMKKEIILSRKLSVELKKLLSERVEVDFERFEIDAERIYDIPVPVVTVLSQGINTNQLNTELALRNFFIEKGYRVEQIGSSESSQFFGLLTTPKFLYGQVDAYYKIIAFNHYVHALVKRKRPDLLIIGVSDSIMRYNNMVLNGLGVLPYIQCNAIRADISIACVNYGIYTKDILERTSLYCHNHLGCPVEFYNIANVGIKYDEMDEEKLGYFTMESKYVEENIQGKMPIEDYYLFNVLAGSSVTKAFAKIEEKLLNNVDNMK